MSMPREVHQLESHTEVGEAQVGKRPGQDE